MAKRYKRKTSSNTGTAWTDEHTDTLLTMYHAGFDTRDIAKALNRSRGAVQQRIYVTGLHKQPKRYETVSVPLTSEDATKHVVSDTTTSILKRWWTRLFGGSDMGAQ